MTPQELKNSILQLAIQGKLVEQRPEEGTAEELYREIQEEKRRLVREGKIKKEKPLPEITEDEVPFEIPGSWKWVKMGELVRVISGVSYKKSDISQKGMRILRGGNIRDMKIHLDNDDVFLPLLYDDVEKRVQVGDVLIVASTGSKAVIGKPGYVDKMIENTMIGAFIRICRPYSLNTSLYIKVIFGSTFYRKHIRDLAQGTNINNVKESYITEFAIPLPPLAEQNRIVAKIEELLPLVDRYEQAWSRMETLNKRFPEDMKKSLLQQAIQGKLVEQRPEEGTAEELYKEIQEEKRRLIKEGKIKKEKPLPEIAQDEVPFEIPGNWKWVRLYELAIIENGDRSSKYPTESDYVEFGIPFLGAKDMVGRYISFLNARYISKIKFNELGNGKLQDGDFVCLLRGSVGKTAMFQKDMNHSTGFICAQMVIIRCIVHTINEYLFHFMETPYYCNAIEEETSGTAVRQLPAKKLANIVVPLPPLAEQKRIVARLEELLPLCERIQEVIK